MKITAYLICALAFGAGCIPHSRKFVQNKNNLVAQASTNKKIQWTFEQQVYLWTYESFRKKGIEAFKLKPDASLEDFRPHLAKILSLPEMATFDDILAHPKVQGILSESLRSKIVSVFHQHLPTNANWYDMQKVIEKIK